MNFLLDTHVFLWLQADPERVRGDVLDQLRAADQLLLSAASAWEISVKHSIGKLELPDAPSVYVPDRMRRSKIDPLPIDITHALAAAALPLHHRDPFDRMLIAQSVSLKLPLVSADRALAPYDAEIIWN